MAKSLRVRCGWAESDEGMRAYHDEEWGVPETDGRALWELLMLEGFQAGLSWNIILRKREGFRKAFKGFDPKKVAKFGEPEIARLMADEGIVRARAKIEATIAGARIYCEMEKSGEGFAEWVWALVGGRPVQDSWDQSGGAGQRGRIPAATEMSEKVSKELKARGFKFVVNDHAIECWRRKAVEKLGKPARK